MAHLRVMNWLPSPPGAIGTVVAAGLPAPTATIRLGEGAERNGCFRRFEPSRSILVVAVLGCLEFMPTDVTDPQTLFLLESNS